MLFYGFIVVIFRVERMSDNVLGFSYLDICIGYIFFMLFKICVV